MSSRELLIVAVLVAAGCSKETNTGRPTPAATSDHAGSATGATPAGSGAGSAGSGSASATDGAGSGSGSAGSGSASATDGAGSGSGSAGSGSASATDGAGSGSAAATGGAGSAGSGPASATDGATGSAGSGSASPFDRLSHDEKVAFMKQKVMPAMKAAFQKFDPKEFARFTCKTCHGKDPQKTKYEMPTRDLPALDFAALKAGKEDPKMVEFMGKVVKPEMARLLGEAEYSDTNPDGFGCLHCHTAKK